MPKSPNEDEDAPRKTPTQKGSDLEALLDAFDIEEQLPHTIQELIDIVDVYRPADRLLLLRQYCSKCGGRLIPAHDCD